MNRQQQIELIRQQFRQYRQRIAELETELEEEQGYCRAEVERMGKRARAYREEMESKERQAESDRYYRDDQIQRITKELESARVYGDEWGENRAIDKLKKL